MVNINILLFSCLISFLIVRVQQRMTILLESATRECIYVNASSGIETIRGEVTNTERRVVFRHVRAGFANNMMGLLASYVIAIVGNMPLVCMYRFAYYP